MPSCLPGFVSGGAALVSGNPYSGVAVPPTGVRLDYLSGGAVYVGTSGAITITSGGALSSGGMGDGLPIVAGAPVYLRIPPDGLQGIKLALPTTLSGIARVFWTPYGN